MGIIEVKNLEKAFFIEKKMINILKGVNLEVKQGEFLCIMGASGSGKTTLLQLLGGIDQTTKGEVKIGDTEISMMNEKELALFRRRKIGFIFQQFNLIPIFNAEENVTLPLLLDNVEQQKATNQAKKLLKIVGLEGKEENLPSQLSGGQQQRVAIARAFANDPEIILADEPTGALDSENSKNIITVLRNACDDLNQTAVVVTHDPFVAAHADRVVFLLDGLIIHEYEETNEKISEKVKRIQEIMNTHFQ
ncbi:ABC transporter ATP-binding protein [Bacillus pseudomycoides]|uniref:ABC transporter ATP-binding protein n=1 Tax=Bacillus pseudomycoides TaxID=64104 RepID=UPI000BED857B|nr:ABC transporter ATP-binding protein [Bacillus pseudomycoides]PDX99413.1 peptide ABC transporter ATP-binding protein [Bacillus pseudomycoides]PEK73425.1 peptide ABC transporter ATP-binding protein [Bacillus pseudomycoides]PEN10123.1 peptide ABC transporter ATP-binding protein [Bacillus pseudomycoides]